MLSGKSSPVLTGLLIPIAKKKSNKVEDVFSNGWLDGMKSSPLPHKKLLKDFKVEVVSDDDTDFAYTSWMKKHPSALSNFETITSFVKGKKVVVFLDYDGTLSPIVDDPDRAFMSDDMRNAVRNVAKYFPTAVISGRSRDEGKEVSLVQIGRGFLPMINEFLKTLVEVTKDIKGAKVDDHKFCTCVHYRNVDEKSWSTIAQRVYDVLKNYPHLQITHGRKVLEVLPVIDWDKGKAVEFLLESLGFTVGDDVLPIFIGDDMTDEDAFKIGNKMYNAFVRVVLNLYTA